MLRSQSSFFLHPCFLIPACKGGIFKNERLQRCYSRPLSTAENPHPSLVGCLTPAPAPGVGWGPASSSRWFRWDEDQAAETPTYAYCVTGSRSRGFAEPVHPTERAQSELAPCNPADKTVMGSHVVTTEIPQSRPTWVEKQRVRWDCQLMKFPSHYLFLIEAIWVTAVRGNHLNPQIFSHPYSLDQPHWAMQKRPRSACSIPKRRIPSSVLGLIFLVFNCNAATQVSEGFFFPSLSSGLETTNKNWESAAIISVSCLVFSQSFLKWKKKTSLGRNQRRVRL